MSTQKLSAALDAAWSHGAVVVSGAGVYRDTHTDLAAALRAIDPDEAAAGIREWLTDRAHKTDHVSLVATGLAWLGGGTRSVEQALLALIMDASSEILVTAYSLTSGSDRVMDALARAASTGIRCVLVVNRLYEQRHDARTWLEDLANRHASVAVHTFDADATEGLHAKVVVADRNAALVGSANLTFHGMTASHELGLMVRGPAAASVASAVDLLIDSPHVRRVR